LLRGLRPAGRSASVCHRSRSPACRREIPPSLGHTNCSRFQTAWNCVVPHRYAFLLSLPDVPAPLANTVPVRPFPVPSAVALDAFRGKLL
jgi:hypothetical protein